MNYSILTGHQTEYNTNPPLRFAQRKGRKRKSDGDISNWTHVREMLAWQRVSGLPGWWEGNVSLLCVEVRFTGALTAGSYGVEASLWVWSGIVTHGDRDRYSG